MYGIEPVINIFFKMKNIEQQHLMKLSTKQALAINAKLPRPIKQIEGTAKVLPVTIALGLQMDVISENDPRRWLTTQPCFLYDGNKKITFPCDASNTQDTTFDYMDSGAYYCVGSSHLGGKYKNHVDVCYPPTMFGFDKTNLVNVPLKSRTGWCCTMGKYTKFRDRIADRIELRHMDCFDDNTYFCYDEIKTDKKAMIDLMFRHPEGNTALFIEKSNNKEDSTSLHWTDNHFSDEYEHTVRRYGDFNFIKRIQDLKGTHIGMWLGPWHKKNLIELVPESTIDYFEPTEKITKPLRAGMPFVVVGPKKFLYYLRKMGFRTFHPFINEDYDKEPNWKKRCNMAVDAMFRLVRNPKNIPEIQEICNHNQNIILKLGKVDHIRRIAKKLRHVVK